MIRISHRGNVKGKDLQRENLPSQVELCAAAGYDVEIDVRMLGKKLYLGHDSPDHETSTEWIESLADKLWIHCKNPEALWHFSASKLNYFWHDRDDYTLTSKGVIWAYPGRALSPQSIAVLPELWTNEKNLGCLGICSDFVADYIIP